MNETKDGKRQAIGVDFGGTTIKCAVVEEGEILRRGNILDTRELGGAEDIVDALAGEISRLNAPSVCAVGVGLPGFVDSINGVVHQLTNVPGWQDVSLRYILRERTGLTVAIENDANAMAYAEWKFGGGKGHTNVVCVTLGTGVGGGLILNGELYRGSQLGAGEIGHTSIDTRGIPGSFGNLGALEKYVGNRQIEARARRAFAAAGTLDEEKDYSPAGLAELAQSGDSVARGLWQEIGTEIGAALANVIWLLNPDAIVIGGGVAKAGDLLFEPIRRTVRSRTDTLFHENLDIVPATLGTDAGIIGTAAIALSLNKRL